MTAYKGESKMNHQSYTAQSRTRDLVKSAIVVSLYMVLTLLVAPVAYGPVTIKNREMIK